MIDIRPPSITGTDHEMLLAIRSYLYQLREQLQYGLENLDQKSGSDGGGVTIITQGDSVVGGGNKTPEETFESIKALIIESADIVNSYYDEINKRLVSEYVAVSDFGAYEKRVEGKISANADGITINNERYEALTAVYQDGGTYATIVKNAGYIKAGFLGGDAYGLEVGQIINDQYVGFGRFTADKISFYDRNGNETAWLSNRRLQAYEVEALQKSQIGGFVDEVDAETGDVKTKWVGRSTATWTRRII